MHGLTGTRSHANADLLGLGDDCGDGEACEGADGDDERQSSHSSFLAFLNTSTIIRGVSLPVFVFCRLGW
jgi:hypothetical protein